MAAALNTHQKQIVVIKFFRSEGCEPKVVQNRLMAVYGEKAVAVETVSKWVNHFKKGETSVTDKPPVGRPVTAVTDLNKQMADLIREDQRISQDELNRFNTMLLTRLLLISAT